MDIIQQCLSLTPVPGLSLAFGLFKGICVTVQQAQASQEQIEVLAQSVASLLKTLDQEYKSGRLVHGGTVGALADLNRLLEEISDFVQRQSSYSFFKLLFVKEQTLSSIEGYQARLAIAVKSFQLAALINIQHWQADNEKARALDQDTLLARLAYLQANQILLLEALDIQKNNPMAMMATLQRRIEERKGGQAELQFYSHSLRCLSTTSGQQVEVKPWTISPFDVEFGPIIGAGGFGKVYKGSWNQMAVALKVMKNSEEISPRATAVRREVDTWSRLRHPHILQFLGANILDENPFIVMPLIKDGNARDYIDDHPNCERLKFIYHISLGLVYLHSQTIVHGDLKGVNVLIDEGERALLCDFGLARIKADVNSRSTGGDTSTLAGSQNWMAPELFRGSSLRSPCDVYSFAMTAYELYTNEIPMGYLSPGLLRELVLQQRTRPSKPSIQEAPQLTEEVWTLITQCWEGQPLTRPSANLVCEQLTAIVNRGLPSSFDTLNLNHSNFNMPPLVIPTNRALPAIPDVNPGPEIPLIGGNPRPRRVTPLPPHAPPSFSSTPSVSSPTSVSPGGTAGPSILNNLLTFYVTMRKPYRRCLTLQNTGNVTCVVQASDGKSLVAGLSTGHFESWDAILGVKAFPDGEEVYRPFVGGPISTITFAQSKDPMFVVGLQTGGVAHHLPLGGFTTILPGNTSPVLCITATNQQVLILNRKHDLMTWAVSHNKSSGPSSTYRLHGMEPFVCTCGAFSPDGKKLYTGTSGGALLVSDANTGQLTRRPLTITSPEAPQGIVATNSHTSRGRGGGTIHARSLSSRSADAPRTSIIKCKTLASSPDGKKVLVGYSTGEIRLWDVRSGNFTVMRDPPPSTTTGGRAFPHRSIAVTFSPDGSRIAYPSLTVPKTIDIQDAGSGRMMASVLVDGCPDTRIQSIDISPNHKRLILSFRDSPKIMMWVWD